MPQRFKEQLVDWQVLHDNLAPRLPDMPALAADHAVLAQVLTKSQELENQQDSARAVLRDVNQQRRETATQGRSTRKRLALGLRHVLGAENEKLIEFGIKPLPRKLQRQQLSAAQKAARAAERAAAKAAAALAKEKPPPPATPATTP
jgi:septal ring factor EnvC (AmiA/AmiB activator)